MRAGDQESFQNTRSRDMRPRAAPLFVDLKRQRSAQPVRAVLTLRGDVFGAAVAYPVLVEMWRRKDHGRGRRRWQAEFTEAERNTIGRYYGKFYDWHLVTGAPGRVACRPRTLALLQRAVAFFASL